MSASRTEKGQVRVHIRWMIRRDMPEVLQTEQESFDFSCHTLIVGALDRRVKSVISIVGVMDGRLIVAMTADKVTSGNHGVDSGDVVSGFIGSGQ